jgi:hypothetical protein
VALAQGDPIAYRYLLLLRFTLANGIALALIGAAAGQGRVGMIFTCRADLGFRGGVQKPGVGRRLRPAAPAAPAGARAKKTQRFQVRTKCDADHTTRRLQRSC